MTYAVKEIFHSLQGEGARTGRAAVFVRFSGCNLWSGREQDRATAACRFCDTDFVGLDGSSGGRYNALDLVIEVRRLWVQQVRQAPRSSHGYVVLAGGEPTLQVDARLTLALRRAGFEIAMETNGTRDVRGRVDWLTVSPKYGQPLAVKTADEIKLVYPQGVLLPETYMSPDHLFDHHFLQPDARQGAEAIEACVDYCMRNPPWSLSLQTHKVIGIP